MTTGSSMREVVRAAVLKVTGGGPDTPSLKRHLRSLLPGGSVAEGGVDAANVVRLNAASQAQKIHQLATVYDSVALRLSAVEARIGTTPGVQGSAAEFDHLRQQYALVVAERDKLLNERDTMLVALQDKSRPGGLTPHGVSKHDFRTPFPVDVLPSAVLPKVTVIDIGAQALANEEHAYQPLITADAAAVIGFEPLPDKAEERATETHVTMLNHFVGDGSRRTFHVNRDDTTSSLLPANMAFLDRFESLSVMCSPVKTFEVDTVRLDDVPGISDSDLLKIDVQGGELDVLKGAPQLLAKSVAVHCEVEFSPVYENQPLFADIDTHLRNAGFELIDVVNAGYATTRGAARPSARSRLLWGEAIYMRRPDLLKDLGAEKIIRAAVIAHVNYGMHDVAASFLSLLEPRDGTTVVAAYGAALGRPA